MAAYTNATQNIPALFEEIMTVNREQEEIRTKDGVVLTVTNWCRMKELRHRMSDLRRAAEKALHWNVDKGNTA